MRSPCGLARLATTGSRGVSRPIPPYACEMLTHSTQTTTPAEPNANTFDGVQTAEYKFANRMDIWLNFISEPGGGTGTYHAGAQVQAIGSGGANSGWIGDNPVISLPSAAGLMLAGLLGLGAVRRRQMS